MHMHMHMHMHMRGMQINTMPHGSRVLIFCSTKRACDGLARAMQRQIGCSGAPTGLNLQVHVHVHAHAYAYH